jgi:hypothetical protein
VLNQVWGVDVSLASALVGREWLASRPCRLTSGERSYSNHWIEGQVGPRVGMVDMEK